MYLFLMQKKVIEISAEPFLIGKQKFFEVRLVAKIN